MLCTVELHPLCGVCMFSPGTPAAFHSPKTCFSGDWLIVNSKLPFRMVVCISVSPVTGW